MKKQVINLMMTLAIVFGLSVSAWAQLAPSSALEVVVGSVTTINFTDDGANAADSYEWEIAEIGNTAAFDGTLNATDVSAKYAYVTSPSNFATPALGNNDTERFVMWLEQPTANTVFCVEVTAKSSDDCSTIRRVFVSVFDFEVDMFLSSVTGVPITADEAACNSWDGLVIFNGEEGDLFQGNYITQPNASYTAEDGTTGSGATKKITETYFSVSINLIGSTSTNLEDLKWRLQYSMPKFVDASFYSIQLIGVKTGMDGTGTVIADAEALFSSQTGDSYIGEDFDNQSDFETVIDGSSFEVPSALSDFTFSGNNALYFPAIPGSATTSTVQYIFRVVTHNNLGANDMVYNLRADRVEMEIRGTAPDAYNDGSKVHADVLSLYTDESLSAAELAGGESVTRTIRQTPATSTIVIEQ